MIMYHSDAEFPIDVHPSRIESMQNKGWTLEVPSQADAIETVEENDDGES